MGGKWTYHIKGSFVLNAGIGSATQQYTSALPVLIRAVKASLATSSDNFCAKIESILKGDDGNEYAWMRQQRPRERCEPGRSTGGKSSRSRNLKSVLESKNAGPSPVRRMRV